MTTYTVFMRYYNEKIGHAVTNNVSAEWFSALTPGTKYIKYAEDDIKNTLTSDKYLCITDINSDRLEANQDSLETLYISSENPGTSENTRVYEDLILPSTDIDNPKYDMLFIYDSLGYYNYKQQKKSSLDKTKNDTEEYLNQTQLYFDKMKRVTIKPWFFHSTYHSLKAAMDKAGTLVNMFGKDSILIGKEVDLTQYIEII